MKRFLHGSWYLRHNGLRSKNRASAKDSDLQPLLPLTRLKESLVLPSGGRRLITAAPLYYYLSICKSSCQSFVLYHSFFVSGGIRNPEVCMPM